MAVCLVEYNEPRMPAGIAKAKAIEAKFVTPGLWLQVPRGDEGAKNLSAHDRSRKTTFQLYRIGIRQCTKLSLKVFHQQVSAI